MNKPSEPLAFTGERFIPGVKGEIWIEHWHRYHFAARWAAGRRVLDVACGEGYGTALLARVAAHATGVDISGPAVDHAKAEYAALANVEFKCASCTRIPLPDASIDVAVSFETVEHIEEQDAFLDELARVLGPGGVLVLSCPNKTEYTDKRNYHNEFHVKELYRAQLAQLVAARFPHVAWFGQRPSFFSVIAPEDTVPAGAAPMGQLVEVDEAHPAEAAASLANPLYYLVVASRDAASLAAIPPAVSVLADRDDWVHHDYEKVMRNLTETVARGAALEAQLRDREDSIIGLQRDVSALREQMREKENALTVALADYGREIGVRDAALADKDRELLRRRSVAWWLKLPVIRLLEFLGLR
jgi:SAM-dependent methyltransferase